MDNNQIMIETLEKENKLLKENIKKIQENTYKYINEGFTSWTNNKHRILDYINSPVECNEKKIK